jgi:hypothetical protein
MRKHNGMRPQDVVILFKMVCLGDNDWTYEDLATQLSISKSEIAESLARSQQAKLVDSTKRKVFKTSLAEFMVHGFRYVFPVAPGSLVLGTPTAHSASTVQAVLKSKIPDLYVWPNSYGTERGLSVAPLHKNVPLAAIQDDNLYNLLALADVMRLGTTEDQKVAGKILQERILAQYHVRQPETPSHF